MLYRMPSSAQFLPVCSSEWALKGFSPLQHVRSFEESLRAGVELGCTRTGFAFPARVPSGSSSTAHGLRDTWGNPGPGVPSVLSVPPTLALPQHGPQPCCHFAPCPTDTARASECTGCALAGTLQHCFFFAGPLIG